MTVAASIAPHRAGADPRTMAIRIAWVTVIAATAILWIAGDNFAPWAVVYPKGLEIPAAKWISAGMNWTPSANLTVRPEVRYDWADVDIASNNGRPYAGEQRVDQWLAGFDVIYLW